MRSIARILPPTDSDGGQSDGLTGNRQLKFPHSVISGEGTISINRLEIEPEINVFLSIQF